MRRKNRLTVYLSLLSLVIVLSLVGGWLLSSSLVEPAYDEQQDDTAQLVDEYFTRALNHMLDKQYTQAVDGWQKLLLINDQLPEAHVNLGFSLFELKQYVPAREHFQRAMELNAFQANAYYGLAICNEELGDLEGALGAMRSYIHLAEADDPYQRKAQSAIWEWESSLGRHSASRESQDAEHTGQGD